MSRVYNGVPINITIGNDIEGRSLDEVKSLQSDKSVVLPSVDISRESQSSEELSNVVMDRSSMPGIYR